MSTELLETCRGLK